MTITPFAFLQRLLIRFGVFVPIDLSIDKANLGGREYGRIRCTDECCLGENSGCGHASQKINLSKTDEMPRFFFLPSLLGPGEPTEVWTYKTSDSWKTTLCHSILFPDGVPPGLMERITAAVLSDIYFATGPNTRNHNHHGGAATTQLIPQSLNREINHNRPNSEEQKLHVREILCWRAAFFLKIGMENMCPDGEIRESVVEIFCHLVDRESHLCVASESMGVGMRRLILSAKGQVGDGGKKIWNGGHKIVFRAVKRVMRGYGGLEFEKQIICPECLQKKPVSQASTFEFNQIRSVTLNGDETMRCQCGHLVDAILLTGFFDHQQKRNVSAQSKLADGEPIVPVTDLLGAVVLVGLWDEKSKKVIRAGSGFIVDKKRGLIVTASHTLMNIWGEEGSPFGEDYFGSRHGKVVIGVIPRSEDGNSLDGTTTVFRYFAKIIVKDDSIETKGVCHMDACILSITTRMEEDVGGDGDGCGDQPEILLLNDPDKMKREKLQQLKVTVNCELDEQVRILGYNQGGEGLRGRGEHLNRTADFARGYVVMKFATDEYAKGSLRQEFKPREEIVVMCYTIGGHSGGPCVNQQGEVIGILSRADSAEKHRCYLVPACEWKPLVKKAKKLSLF
uniref:Serine protease n=2 Tax=Ditylum brightwellii TaxID=49249 RepID=A0A6V2IF37_9STRA